MGPRNPLSCLLVIGQEIHEEVQVFRGKETQFLFDVMAKKMHLSG